MKLLDYLTIGMGLGAAIGGIGGLAAGDFAWGRGVVASIAHAAIGALVLTGFTMSVVAAFRMRRNLPDEALPDT